MHGGVRVYNAKLAVIRVTNDAALSIGLFVGNNNGWPAWHRQNIRVRAELYTHQIYSNASANRVIETRRIWRVSLYLFSYGRRRRRACSIASSREENVIELHVGTEFHRHVIDAAFWPESD